MSILFLILAVLTGTFAATLLSAGAFSLQEPMDDNRSANSFLLLVDAIVFSALGSLFLGVAKNIHKDRQARAYLLIGTICALTAFLFGYLARIA